MKLYRIMSFEEFKKFINGETLVAYNHPSEVTSAIEPKFYFSNDMYELAKYGIENDVICEFKADKGLFERGYGKIFYSLNFRQHKYTEEVLEYHISEYNNKKMKLTNCVSPELLKILTNFETIQYFKQKKDRTITPEFLEMYNNKKFYKDFLKYIDELNFIRKFKNAELYYEYWDAIYQLDMDIEEYSDYLLYGEKEEEDEQYWYEDDEEEDFLYDDIDRDER